MYFEGRELKEFAEPVDPGQLMVGKTYFSLNFVDIELLIPMLEAVVFAGRNLEKGDEDILYFQDVDSYRSGIRYASGGDAVFQSGPAKQCGHIYEFEHALDQLLACSLRRNAAGR